MGPFFLLDRRKDLLGRPSLEKSFCLIEHRTGVTTGSVAHASVLLSGTAAAVEAPVATIFRLFTPSSGDAAFKAGLIRLRIPRDLVALL